VGSEAVGSKGQQTPSAPTGRGSATEVLAATIAAVVEKQLAAQSAAVNRQLAAQREAADQYQRALQHALEERLRELGQHQARQIAELDARVTKLTDLGNAGAASTAFDTDYVDHQIAVLTGRLDEAMSIVRRFDEQAGALVQHVNETTAGLSKRMDEGDQALAHAVEQRLVAFNTAFEQIGPDVQRQLGDHTLAFQSKLDAADSRGTDRMLALEERIKDEQGTKIANVEATVGRIGAGFDDAMVAISQRVLDMENKLHDANDRIGMLADQISRVDESAINEVREQISSAVGEAMLVRIELDRVISSTDEKLDKAALRMSDIEAKLEEESDVSAAVQLERLDELERAIVLLDPSKFVRRTDTGAVQQIAPGMPRPGSGERSTPPTAPPPAGPISQELQAIVNNSPAQPNSIVRSDDPTSAVALTKLSLSGPGGNTSGLGD
jgi:hypothetical protein